MNQQINEINPETGKKDGFLYTFGNSKVAIVLIKKLIETNKQDKVGKIHRLLSDFEDGLRVLSASSTKTKTLKLLKALWRENYFSKFDSLLSNQEGRTYLLNLATVIWRKYKS